MASCDRAITGVLVHRPVDINMDQTITEIFIFATLIVIAVFDAIMAFGNKTSNRLDTISGRFQTWSKKVAMIPYAWGVLAGHFFWPGDALWGQPKSVLITIGVGLALSSLHFFIHVVFTRLPLQLSLLYLAIGVVMGHLGWPQAL